MPEVEQERVLETIQQLGPRIRGESHLLSILRRIKRDQAKIVFEAIRPHLTFKTKSFSKLMRGASIWRETVN